MRNMRGGWKLCVVLMVFSVLTFVGCDLGKKETSEAQIRQALMERATQYWRYRVEGDYAKAYDYESPTFRKAVKLQDYLQTVGSSVKWLEATPMKVRIDGSKGVVDIKIRYVIFTAAYFPKNGIVKEQKDRWEYVDGEWYHLMGGSKAFAVRRKRAEPPAGTETSRGNQTEE